MEIFKNRQSIQIRFSDIDLMGHVSNTVYQVYYDSGRIAYFNEVLPDLDFKDIGVVSVSVNIEYYRPIFLHSKVYVESRCSKIGNKSFEMEHRIVDQDTGEVYSTSKNTLVCFAINEQQSICIPGHWKENILAYDEGVGCR
ncbi:MAG: acyl-CoA thioesterase [Prolixibacteraceae bacterium]|jgi:acyl-CoA thioester hydrolase|nr:acyl-CoA thioesterase [Prolixibacteraceae bacterium]